MDIDPALKGTTFAKALEAAEQARLEKEAARALETGRRGGIPVITQSRALAQALRGQPIDNSLITQEIPRMTQTTPDIKAKPYSEAQVKILARGLETDAFKLPQGTAAHRLFDEKLIEMADPKGNGYRLTPLGRTKAAMLVKSLQSAAAAVAPAPSTSQTLTTSPETKQALAPRPVISDLPVEVAALHIQLKQVTTLANDRGAKVDELTKKTDELTKQLRQAEAEVERLSGLSGDGMNNAAEQIEYYAGQVDTLTARIKQLEASSAPGSESDASLIAFHERLMEAFTESMEMDGYNGSAFDYILWLRQMVTERTEQLNIESAIVDAINEMAAADGKGEMDPRDFVVMKVQAVRDLMAQNDDYLHMIDGRDSTIESLRRCVDELEMVSEAWETRYRAADQYNFDALILNELCAMLPEAEKYRAGREAIEKLKKRS